MKEMKAIAIVEKGNYTYILRCADGTFYTGWTNDLTNRLHQHNQGQGGAKYTKSRRPVELVYVEELESRSQAMKREAQIKKMTRAQKEALIHSQSTKNPIEADE